MSLIVFVVIAFIPALTGAFFTPGEWYDQLDKPSWNPPSWLFGPVWTVLYALIGVSAWLIWRRYGEASIRWGLVIWAVQLALNAIWTPVFFGLKRPDLAVPIILALVLAIIANIVAFWVLDLTAACLLLPYLAWVSFASALNIAVWRLNA